MNNVPLSEEWHREQRRKHDLAKRFAEVIYKYGESELSDTEVSLLQNTQLKKMVESFLLPMIASSQSYTHIIRADWYLKNQNQEVFRECKLRMSTSFGEGILEIKEYSPEARKLVAYTTGIHETVFLKTLKVGSVQRLLEETKKILSEHGCPEDQLQKFRYNLLGKRNSWLLRIKAG